jgi:hypothetical protein
MRLEPGELVFRQSEIPCSKRGLLSEALITAALLGESLLWVPALDCPAAMQIAARARGGLSATECLPCRPLQ